MQFVSNQQKDLTIPTAASLGLSASTLAKYTAAATVEASARVAKWQHTWGAAYLNNETARTFYQLNGDTAAARTRASTDAIPFTITNDSEVAAAYTLFLYGYNTDDVEIRDVGMADTDISSYATFATTSATGVTRVGTTNTFQVAPGTTANFNVKLTPPTSYTLNSTWRCRVYIRAEQID